jgi:rhodanese-related sulfurtransferase
MTYNNFHILNVTQTVEFLKANPEVVVLDFRDKEFFNLEHLPNATFLKLEELDDFIKSDSKSKVYLVHCAAGVRSLKASQILVDNGFENVYCAMEGYRKIKEELEK